MPLPLSVAWEPSATAFEPIACWSSLVFSLRSSAVREGVFGCFARAAAEPRATGGVGGWAWEIPSIATPWLARIPSW